MDQAYPSEPCPGCGKPTQAYRYMDQPLVWLFMCYGEDGSEETGVIGWTSLKEEDPNQETLAPVSSPGGRRDERSECASDRIGFEG